jgi:uncharacterized membrane protein YfcA
VSVNPDLINGLFELGGGILLTLNCLRLYKDKALRGVSPLPTVFFTSWGFWNLYFYPSVNAWYSFYGGLLIVVINCFWLGQIIFYSRRKNASRTRTSRTT